MKLGICLPHYGRPIEPRRLLEVVRCAEERGLDSAWVTDHVIVPRETHVIYREDMLDPLAVLSWLAGVTERIALGTSICPTARPSRWRSSSRASTSSPVAGSSWGRRSVGSKASSPRSGCRSARG